MWTRRQFIAGLGVVTVSNLAYGRWIEPRWLKITRPQINLGQAQQPPLRVLHLSDLHYSVDVPLSFIDEAIHLGLAEKPDLILVTGDFITGSLGNIAGSLGNVTGYARVLAQLPAAAPTFACLGNHDGGVWGPDSGPNRPRTVTELLGHANIPCLYNSSRSVQLGTRHVQILGVGDLWAGDCSPAVAFQNAPPRGDALRLVLNHNPDAKDRFRPFDWDMMLCGHTHGGQIRVPFVGATPLAPVQDKRYVAGLYRWENRWLHVSCGVGNLHGFRYNCRPEFSLLTIA